jgi:hypothetical protein
MKRSVASTATDVKSEFVAQVLLNFFEFVLAQDSVVDEDAGQAGFPRIVAHGTIDENGRDRGIDSSGKRADGAAVADLCFHLGDGRVDEVLAGPGGRGSADVESAKLRRMSLPSGV